MAVIATFKQKCPSCESMVSIKETMHGKKVECTKCKDKFIAKKPKEVEEELEVDIEEDEESSKKSTKVNGKKSTTMANGKRPKMELSEKNGKASTKNKSETNGKANGKAKKAKADEDEDEDDDKTDKKKKKKPASGGPNKLVIGLGLAVVGVLVLAVAAFFLMRNPSGTGGRVTPGPNNNQNNEQPENPEDKKDPPKKIETSPTGPSTSDLSDAEISRLSNLLPGDSEHVFALYLANVFSKGSTLRNAVFETPGAIDEASLRRRLSFALSSVDHMIMAERYTFPGWRYSVIHLKEVINESELKKALNLESAGNPIEGQGYYKIGKANPAFDQLARFSIGIPGFARHVDKRSDKPTFVRIHNPQTLIVGDLVPVQAFLKVKGQFPAQSTRQPATPPEKKTPPDPEKKDPTPPGGEGDTKTAPPDTGDNPMPKKRPGPGKIGRLSGFEDYEFTMYQPPGRGKSPIPKTGDEPQPLPEPQPPEKQPDPKDPKDPKDPMPKDPTPPSPGVGPREDGYLTVKPSLKALLDKMESRGSDKERILFASATDMEANVVSAKETGVKDTVVRAPRPFWDVTLQLRESKSRIRHLGTALVQKDTLKFQLRNEFICAQEFDAKQFQDDINERVAFQVAKFLHQIVKHDVKLPADAVKKDPEGKEPPPPPGGEPKQEEKKSDEPNSSQITVSLKDKTVEFALDLFLDNAVLTQAHGIAAMLAGVLRTEIDAASFPSLRHNLGNAGKVLGDKGLSAQQVDPGSYPPGAFPRTNARNFTDKEPRNRISWMAALLPYMNQKSVYDRIQFDQSWRDPGNWLAGHATIPQFLDPTYPYAARHATVPGLPLEFGATHYVGVAGVGLDAATFKRGDPATVNKRGVFSYDGAASVAEIIAGRGVSNTVLMIQVPHDRGAGVTPWIGGGGATIRGVPEKDSIKPFVLGNDKSGKSISEKGKKGTFVLMADGTVRFVGEDISDDVFKTMVTIEGQAPEKFDLKSDPNTQLIPAPESKQPAAKQPEPKSTEKVPETKSDDKKQPDEKGAKKDASNFKDTLQGAWIAKSIEAKGQPAPPEAVKSMQFTFKGDKLFVRGNFKDDREEEGSYKIDMTKTPAQIDYSVSGQQKTVIGIIELSGDELRVCFRHNSSDGARPTAFAAKEDGVILVVLTKAKS